jgi:hypothetical protein
MQRINTINDVEAYLNNSNNNQTEANDLPSKPATTPPPLSRQQRAVLAAFEENITNTEYSIEDIKEALFVINTVAETSGNSEFVAKILKDRLDTLQVIRSLFLDIEKHHYTSVRTKRDIVIEELERMNGFYLEKRNGDIHYCYTTCNGKSAEITLHFDGALQDYVDDKVVQRLTHEELIDHIVTFWHEIVEID